MAGGLGFLLGAFYDVFRVIRLLMRPSAKVVFFQDLLFFALSSVVTFLFALAVTGGELRFYLFLGLVTGFMAGRRFFSRSAFFGNFYAVPSPPWLDFFVKSAAPPRISSKKSREI